MVFQEEKSQGQATSVVSHSTELATMDAKKSNQIIYQEIVQQWKEEDEAVEAKCKANLIYHFLVSFHC